MQFKDSPAFINFLKTLAFFTLVSFFYRCLFAWYHIDKFPQIESHLSTMYALLYGLRFDLSLSAYISLLCSFSSLVFRKFPKIQKTVFISFFLILAGVHVSDIMYFEESSRHLSYELKALDSSSSGLLFTAFSQHSLLMFIHILVQLGVSSFLWLKLIPKVRYKDGKFFSQALQAIAIVAVFIISSRGGLQMIPLKPEFAYQVGDSSLASLASNGAYSVLYSSAKDRELKTPDFPFTSKEPEQAIHSFYKNINSAPTKELEKKNIVVVLLEGWSATHVSLYNSQLGTTPEFDRLAKKAITSKMMFAEGHRTTEGIFSVFCSYPNPLGKTVAQTQLQDFNYLCLPEILKRHSWTTAFFQGSLKETSGTGSFAQSLGFTKSYGRDDIPNKKYGLNYWGKHDGDIYDFAIEKAQKYPQPFLLGINTNSTHDLQIPENWEPAFKGEDKKNKIRSIIHYSDAMLGKFVEDFFDKFPNSIIVLVADHSSHAHGDMLEQFAIPFAIISPDLDSNKIDTLSSHRDVAPSIAGLLGIPNKEYAHFTGVDLLNNTTSFASLYHAGSYAFAHKDKLYEYSFPAGKLKMDTFKIDGMKKIRLENESNPLENFYFSFVSLTQKLLFSGKTKDFHSYKNELTCCFDNNTGNNQ